MLCRIVIRVIVENNVVRFFYAVLYTVTLNPVFSVPVFHSIFLDPAGLLPLNELVDRHCAHFRRCTEVNLNTRAGAVGRQTGGCVPIECLLRSIAADHSGSVCYRYFPAKRKVASIIYHVLIGNGIIDLLIAEECRCLDRADPVRKDDAVVILRRIRCRLASIDRISDVNDTARTVNLHGQISAVYPACR